MFLHGCCFVTLHSRKDISITKLCTFLRSISITYHLHKWKQMTLVSSKLQVKAFDIVITESMSITMTAFGLPPFTYS
jgi:hypothetical protein